MSRFTRHFCQTRNKKLCVIMPICAYTAGGKPHPSPPSSDLPPHLLRSNSPLSAQRSSSTPAGGQPHPSPCTQRSSSTPPAAVTLSLPHPAVILHLWWWATSPLQETRKGRRETRDGRREMGDERRETHC